MRLLAIPITARARIPTRSTDASIPSAIVIRAALPTVICVAPRSRVGRAISFETMWVHDASNEKARCRLAEAVAQGNAVTFTPDSVAQAHDDGFDDCPHCLGPDPVPPGGDEIDQ